MTTRTICIDFDDTLCGRDDLPLPGAKEAVFAFKTAGCRVVVGSARLDPKLLGELLPLRIQKLKDWCQQHGLAIDDVVAHKPVADIYVDDKGCHFNGDWGATRQVVTQRLRLGKP